MRILFVTKNFLIEPLGIMYLMSALKKAGHIPDIIQTDKEDIDSYITNFRPKIIAYSLTTGTHVFYQKINQNLKKKYKFLAIFGGPHATFFPDELMKDEAVNIVCIGEGEEAIVELADAVEAGKKYELINNLWVRRPDKIYKNDVRPFIDLDKVEFPERRLIYEKYELNRSNPIKNIITTRGCPFNCPYCYNHLLKKIYLGKGKYVRQRSVSNVIDEAIAIKKNYPVKMIYFQDDIFAINKQWLKNFARQYKSKVGVSYHCHLRVNLVDEETVSLLADSGCIGVSFAIETGNDEIRNKILGRNMSKAQIVQVAKILKKYNIKFRIFNMIGLPGGSIKTDLETLKLNINCRPTLGWVSIYQPFPKTDLYNLAKELNLCKNIELDKFNNFFEDSVLELPDKNKLKNLQRLFSFIVSWPILFPITRILISLPFTPVYDKISDMWKDYCNNKLYFKA